MGVRKGAGGTALVEGRDTMAASARSVERSLVQSRARRYRVRGRTRDGNRSTHIDRVAQAAQNSVVPLRTEKTRATVTRVSLAILLRLRDGHPTRSYRGREQPRQACRARADGIAGLTRADAVRGHYSELLVSETPHYQAQVDAVIESGMQLVAVGDRVVGTHAIVRVGRGTGTALGVAQVKVCPMASDQCCAVAAGRRRWRVDPGVRRTGFRRTLVAALAHAERVWGATADSVRGRQPNRSEGMVRLLPSTGVGCSHHAITTV